LHPNIDTIYVERAYNYYKLEKHQAALKDIEKAININFNNSKAYLLKGMIYKKINDFENALKAYTHIIYLEDSIYLNEALLKRAELYHSTNQLESAYDDLSVLIMKDSLNYEAYVNRGIAKQRIDQYFNLKDTFKRIYADENSTKEIFKILGLSYNDSENVNATNNYIENEALKDFNKAIKLNPNDAYAFVNRAKLYANLKLDSLALNDINKANSY